MLVADYPTTDVELTASELEQIEYALRNPATSEMIEGYDVGPADVSDPCEIVLYQLTPLREHARPWVLVMVEWGDRSVLAFDSLRLAQHALASGLECLETAYAESFGEPDTDSDDDD